MMLGKDYMLAIVIVNYEGRCICRSRLETTPWGRSWNAGLSVSVCVCLCVSEYVPKCGYMRVSPPTRGMKFVSVIVL